MLVLIKIYTQIIQIYLTSKRTCRSKIMYKFNEKLVLYNIEKMRNFLCINLTFLYQENNDICLKKKLKTDLDVIKSVSVRNLQFFFDHFF